MGTAFIIHLELHPSAGAVSHCSAGARRSAVKPPWHGPSWPRLPSPDPCWACHPLTCPLSSPSRSLAPPTLSPAPPPAVRHFSSPASKALCGTRQRKSRGQSCEKGQEAPDHFSDTKGGDSR